MCPFSFHVTLLHTCRAFHYIYIESLATGALSPLWVPPCQSGGSGGLCRIRVDSSSVTGGRGGGLPQVTPSRGWNPNETILRLNLYRNWTNAGRWRGWEGAWWRDGSLRSHHFSEDDDGKIEWHHQMPQRVTATLVTLRVSEWQGRRDSRPMLLLRTE